LSVVTYSEKRNWFSTVAELSWVGAFIGAVGFAYIALPTNLQINVRRLFPYEFRELCLSYFSTHEWIFLLFIVSALCLCWGAISPKAELSKCQKHIDFIESEYKTLSNEHIGLRQDYEEKLLDCYQIFSDHCILIFNRLKLTSNERVSIYKLELDHFRCIGRFSTNESFKAKPDRMYAKSIGVLGLAWERGGLSEAESPCPVTELEKYLEFHHTRYRIPKDLARNSNMKSRAFCAVRIEDYRQAPIAVIIVESTEKNGVPFGKIGLHVNREEQRRLASLIDGLSSHMVSVEHAHEEGF